MAKDNVTDEQYREAAQLTLVDVNERVDARLLSLASFPEVSRVSTGAFVQCLVFVRKDEVKP